eukprot:GHVT01050366.1.p1 GENE.GHVT01050366.1~~GHVT01050366.1.p1  ORF type:complete len:126 (+),score=5.44 GHVT01050366.1:196-573(+)
MQSTHSTGFCLKLSNGIITWLPNVKLRLAPNSKMPPLPFPTPLHCFPDSDHYLQTFESFLPPNVMARFGLNVGFKNAWPSMLLLVDSLLRFLAGWLGGREASLQKERESPDFKKRPIKRKNRYRV